MLPGSRYRSALLHNTLQWAGQPQGRSYFRCVVIPWHPSAPGGLVARCCAYIFSDAGVCRTPREKPHDRTPTNRLTDARTKSRSLASAAAPASASMAARCAIQILWTNPGLAISGRRGNGSAGVSIYVQHPTNSEVKVSISGCAMRILEKNGSEAVFPEMCVLNGVGPNWNGVIFGGSILWSQSVPRVGPSCDLLSTTE